MQFHDSDTSQLNRRTVAAVFVCGVLMFLALGVAGKAASTNTTGDQTKINGVWSGELVEKNAGGNPKGHGYLYLRLEQSADGIRGVIPDNEASATPISDAVLTGNHLRFSAQA